MNENIKIIKPLNYRLLMVFFSLKAVPHTPFPILIVVQATSPWKGPRYKVSPLAR